MNTVDVQLSPEFRSRTSRAITSIAAFIFVYLLILILSIGLTALCIFGGAMLIITIPRLFTIALGIGLASLGVLVLIFLLKFVFKSHKIDRSHLIQIKKDDQPELFELIDEIVQEVGTDFPQKVYLSHEVNASVFYNSSFWSMFLPIRKNLMVGMGLVNSITRDELKAILSHEFGHFSQKTMKVGSYVYNVNQVIFNMLYENESYDKLIQSWASVSGYFSIFVVIAVKIIEGIQWILRKMYDLVNKSYLGLSREMEFHADEIAASVTGYLPLRSSLLRMSLADYSFNSVFEFYESKVSENLKSENVFQEHSYAMQFHAEEGDLKLINGLPEVSLEELNKFQKSKLVIEDQWSSHPSTEERIQRLERGQRIKESHSDKPANQIFRNVEELQKEFTRKLFSQVQYKGEAIGLSFLDFQSAYREKMAVNKLSKVYKGYYDDKNPLLKDLEISSEDTVLEVESLFSVEKVDLVYRSIGMKNDRDTLVQIANKLIPVKTFDYDGKKYKHKEAKELAESLGDQYQELERQIEENDRRIYHFFKSKEVETGQEPQLERLYREFLRLDEEIDQKFELYSELNNELQFINYNTEFDVIRSNFTRFRSREKRFKEALREMLNNPLYQEDMSAEMRSDLENYLSKEWAYFSSQAYIDTSLDVLFGAINNFAYLLSRGYFVKKKEILNYQESLL